MVKDKKTAAINYERFKIVGQGYAWITKNNNLTIDSWENLRPDVDDAIIVPMLIKFAKEVTLQTNSNIIDVTIGTGGKTPIPFRSRYVDEPEVMKEGNQYNDSKNQYLIYRNKEKFNIMLKEISFTLNEIMHPEKPSYIDEEYKFHEIKSYIQINRIKTYLKNEIIRDYIKKNSHEKTKISELLSILIEPSLLVAAINHSSLELVKFILENQLDLEAFEIIKNSEGTYFDTTFLLPLAIKTNNNEIIKLLAEQRIDLEKAIKLYSIVISEGNDFFYWKTIKSIFDFYHSQMGNALFEKYPQIISLLKQTYTCEALGWLLEKGGLKFSQIFTDEKIAEFKQNHLSGSLLAIFAKYRPELLYLEEKDSPILLHQLAQTYTMYTHLDCFEKLKPYKINYDVQDKDGNTLAIILASRVQFDQLQLLLDQKADFTIRNKRGFTPLYIYLTGGSIEKNDNGPHFIPTAIHMIFLSS